MRFRKPEHTIIIVCVHKGASTFFANPFAEAACKAIPRLSAIRVGAEVMRGTKLDEITVPMANTLLVRVYPRHLPTLLKSYQSRESSDAKLVFIQRDPRDAAVSMYYSAAYSHPVEPGNTGGLLDLRDQLQNQTVADGVAEVAEHLLNEFILINRMIDEHPASLSTTYEDLVTQYPSWLETFTEHVEWSNRVRKRVYKATHGSFEPPKSEDPNQHKRRITPGNWKEVFDQRLIEMFESKAGDQMRASGYHW